MCAARVWFTADNTEGLPPADLAILNRAVRRAWPASGCYGEPRRLDLEMVRFIYKPGMSAADIIRVMDDGNSKC